MIRFIRGVFTHFVLIALVLVLGFLCGMLAGYVWPPKPAQPSLHPPSIRIAVT